MTDQLSSEIGNIVRDKLKQTKPNGPDPAPHPHPEQAHAHPLRVSSSALQSIAQQISRLSYLDMMTLAKGLSNTNDQVLAEHPVEIADLLHAWATAEIEHSSAATG